MTTHALLERDLFVIYRTELERRVGLRAPPPNPPPHESRELMNSDHRPTTSSLERFSPCWFSQELQRSLPSIATFIPLKGAWRGLLHERQRT